MALRPDPRRTLWAVIAWLALTLWVPRPDAQAIHLQPQDQRVALWQGLQTVADPQGQFTPQQANDRVAAGRAGQLEHANATYGKWLPHPYWAQFELHNPGPSGQQWLITYEYPTQDAVALWANDGPGAKGTWGLTM